MRNTHCTYLIQGSDCRCKKQDPGFSWGEGVGGGANANPQDEEVKEVLGYDFIIFS